LDVVSDSLWWSRDRDSSQQNVVGSWDVDNPSGIGVTLVQNNVSVLSHFGWGDSDEVIQSVSILAGDGKSRPLNDFVDIISGSSESVLVSSIASSDVIEFSGEASSS